MNALNDILDKILSPKFVLILFALTACYAMITGKLDAAVFSSALGTVLGYFYGSKQGEAAANLANAQVNAALGSSDKIIMADDLLPPKDDDKKDKKKSDEQK